MNGRRVRRTRILRVGGLVAIGVLIEGYWVLPWMMPIPASLREAPRMGLDFRDAEGRSLRKTLAGEVRVEAPLAPRAVPEVLKLATVSAEDKRFWKHGGIDFVAVARAARDGLANRQVVSGASTITQQLVKITSPRRLRTPRTKLIEMLTARKVEMLWSKERILAEYLNRLDYGNLLQGCSAAAWGYFGKPVGDLSLAEGAFLAGIPRAPTRLNPYRNREATEGRKQWILGKLYREGKVGESEVARALLEPLKLVSAYQVFEAPHAVDLLMKGVGGQKRTGGGALPLQFGKAAGGARSSLPFSALRATKDRKASKGRLPALQFGEMRTTIDLDLQKAVERILSTALEEMAEQNARHGAVVVIEVATGNVVALAGSGDYFSPAGGQLNGAWLPRSPGSALKPFTYLLALEKGDSMATIVDDLPVEYSGEEGVYSPVNYDRRFYGPMSYREALANSLNVSAVVVLDRVGGEAVLRECLEDCGFTSLSRPAGEYGLGLTLGNAEVRLLELTNAYACLARLGTYRPWRLSEEGETESEQVFESEACYLIADILSDPLARNRAFGAHSVLELPFKAACKTGTSTDFRDNWTMGYTPEYAVGVWVGNFTNEPMRGVSGVTGAGPIFNRVFRELHREGGSSWYGRPATIVEAEVDVRNGKGWSAASGRGGTGAREAFAKRQGLFRKWNLPSPAVAGDYDEAGRVLLDSRYANWVKSEDNWLGDGVEITEGFTSGSECPLILFPLPESTIYLDPDLPEGGRHMPLRVEGDREVRWSSETIRINVRGERAVAELEPGRHRLRAAGKGEEGAAEVWVNVVEL